MLVGGLGMHRQRLDRLMAGTAVALLLTISGTAFTATETPPAIEAAVPVPEPANVPPPTKADIGDPAASPAAAKPDDQPDIKALTGKDLIKAPLAATIAAEDSAVADKLRELLATRADRFISRKTERQAAEAFYRDRGFAPLWVERGAPSARAMAAIAYLRGVDADGLNPADYPAPDFKSAEPAARAEAELKFTSTLFDYARHAQNGRVHWSRLHADIFYNQVAPDPTELLANLASNRDMRAILDAYEPQHPQYKALKAKLAEARGKNAEEIEVVRVPEGPTIKPGMNDARVVALRKRLKADGDDSNTAYDGALVEAVKKFQTGAGMQPDGLVGPATVRALNGGPKRERIPDIIVANLERWRWLPRDLGNANVILNIPDYTLRVTDNGVLKWQTRVVVGKPSTATPLLSDKMKYITVNPTWNVPPSIVDNEYLPVLQQDPTALERLGLKLVQNKDGTVHIYQPPGAGNALGRIRFNFPNRFLVYQHDTPDKHLFAKDVRAYSHGCMRVQNPDKYAEVLLGIALPKENYTVEKIHKMYGGSEININFPTPIPVHITYQTAFVDDAGELQIRDDIYGRDARVLAILKGDERRVADIAVDRKGTTQTASRTVYRLPGRADNSLAEFFQRLFR
ncbi:MAG: L,D-transpeptidase family protein [Rhizobiales bacterium]|nr:L,D-transpeptidase family protein [Hyphomicrobiales bacterium]